MIAHARQEPCFEGTVQNAESIWGRGAGGVPRGGCPLTGVRKQFPEEVTFKGAKE